MSLETIKDARRIATRGGMLALGVMVALACPACASKEKVASGPMGGAGMAPPPMTAAYDPSRQVASGVGNSPWGSPSSSTPAGMPMAAANGYGSNPAR